MSTVLLINALTALFEALLMLIDAALFPATSAIFVESAAMTATMGGVVFLIASSQNDRFSRLYGFLLTSTVWLTAAAAGALPLSLWGLTPVDATFEAMSAITTTGSTVMSGLDTTPHGVLLWRAMLQMLGGVGFVVAAMALLPALRIGGMQLFRTESSDQGEKELKSATLFALVTLSIYVGLIVLAGIVYAIGGMSVFDAATHAMTTLSTGGFSNYDASFGHFDSGFLQWSGTFFMALGGLPFVWYLRIVTRRSIKSEQVVAFLRMVAIVVVILTFWLWLKNGGSLFDDLRLVAFNVISVVTTTGYATADYTLWGPFAAAVFFFLTASGGCTGSTSGGVKTMRWVILGRAMRSAVKRIHQPHGVFPVRYEGHVIGEDVLNGVVSFMAFFVFSVVILAVLLDATGLDLVTSVTGALTAIANVGPGLGDTIGPAGNFEPLADTPKLLLSFGMYAGRLEMLTVYVLLVPAFWAEV